MSMMNNSKFSNAGEGWLLRVAKGEAPRIQHVAQAATSVTERAGAALR